MTRKTDLCNLPANPTMREIAAHALAAESTPPEPGPLYELTWENSRDRGLPQQPPPGWDSEPAPAVRADGSPMISIASRANGDPTRAGEHGVRFDLRRTDAVTNNGTRAELSFWPPEPRGVERWYGLSTYLKDWAPDQAPESIFQWHQGGEVPCPHGCSPTLAIVNRKNTATGAFEQHLHQAWRETQGDDTYIETDTVIGPCDSNRWVDWVVHVVWATDASGLLQIWRDGNPVIDAQGRTDDFDDGTHHDWGNYLKFGIYKWPWSQGKPSDVAERIMFADEIRIADSNGSYETVKPRDDNVPPGDVLAPDHDLPPDGWLLHGADTVTAALAGPERQPNDVPPPASYIWASDAGRVAEVALQNPGRALAGGAAWCYANTGSTTTLLVQLLVAGHVVADLTVGPGAGFAWRPLPLAAVSPDQAAQLALRFLTIHGWDSNVRAAYLEFR